MGAPVNGVRHGFLDQRLEYGEHSISAASMRLELAVCAVLKIDPFQLVFGDGDDSPSDLL